MRRLMLAAAVVVAAGCYHATIETGRPAGTQKVEQKWAPGWLWGLVPPPTVNAAQGCASGVARVETQHSFLNEIVAGLTGGIFTPMTITVTCASGGISSTPTLHSRPGESVEVALARAVAEAERTHEAVYVNVR